MPLYEYRCKECGHVSTFLEKAGSRKPHACETCGSKKTERLLSAFATHGGEGTSGGDTSCPTGTCPLG